jgi:hypothetical protein
MILQAGNPNLKKKAMRVNKMAPLASFAEKSPDKNPKRYVSGGALLMPKDPNAALPNTISIWEHPTYVPPKAALLRLGADDFLNIKSKGV